MKWNGVGNLSMACGACSRLNMGLKATADSGVRPVSGSGLNRFGAGRRRRRQLGEDGIKNPLSTMDTRRLESSEGKRRIAACVSKPQRCDSDPSETRGNSSLLTPVIGECPREARSHSAGTHSTVQRAPSCSTPDKAEKTLETKGEMDGDDRQSGQDESTFLTTSFEQEVVIRKVSRRPDEESLSLAENRRNPRFAIG